MQNNSLYILFSILLTVVFGISCLKTEEYPIEPSISLNEFTPKNNGAAVLKLDFTDGDGDIGLNPSDTFPPFDIESEYYYNLFIKYFEMQNGEWVFIPIDNPPLSYRTPFVTPNGQNKALKGVMTIDLSLYYNPFSSFDTLKLEVQLIDRALHESNTLEIGPLIKP